MSSALSSVAAGVSGTRNNELVPNSFPVIPQQLLSSSSLSKQNSLESPTVLNTNVESDCADSDTPLNPYKTQEDIEVVI